MIGKNLTALLLSKGHEITWLSRTNKNEHGISCLTWDQLNSSSYSPEVVINLAGHNLDCRWTAANRFKILESRVEGTRKLVEAILSGKWATRLYIGASAIGLYSPGPDRLKEDSQQGKGFLADVVSQWELSSEALSHSRCDRVLFRFPAVLSNKGGMIGKLKTPTRLMGGVVLGSGKQWTPFAHIDDISSMITYAIEHGIPAGTYNAAAPNVPDHATLVKAFSESLGKKVLIKSTPEWPLKLFLGERSCLVLDSMNVDSSKLLITGFTFQFSDIYKALDHLSKNENS